MLTNTNIEMINLLSKTEKLEGNILKLLNRESAVNQFLKMILDILMQLINLKKKYEMKYQKNTITFDEEKQSVNSNNDILNISNINFDAFIILKYHRLQRRDNHR